MKSLTPLSLCVMSAGMRIFFCGVFFSLALGSWGAAFGGITSLSGGDDIRDFQESPTLILTDRARESSDLYGLMYSTYGGAQLNASVKTYFLGETHRKRIEAGWRVVGIEIASGSQDLLVRRRWYSLWKTKIVTVTASVVIRYENVATSPKGLQEQYLALDPLSFTAARFRDECGLILHLLVRRPT